MQGVRGRKGRGPTEYQAEQTDKTVFRCIRYWESLNRQPKSRVRRPQWVGQLVLVSIAS